MATKKALLITIPAAFLTLAAVLAWRLNRKEEAPQATPAAQRAAVPVAVETAPVLRATIRETAEFPGSLAPQSHVIVAPKVAGRLEKLLVEIGDPVARGELIAVLDDEELTQQVEQSKAELQVALANFQDSQSSLETAKRELERVKALFEKNIASGSEFDQAEAQVQKAGSYLAVTQAQVRQKEAAVRAAEIRLSQTQIRATWEDRDEMRVVGERFADAGALLKANDPIISVLDIGTLLGVVSVTEKDYARIKKGQQADISADALPGRQFSGEVFRIAPFLVESTRQAEVRIRVPNPAGLLKPGMSVRARIEFFRHENTLSVSSAALVTRGGQQGVFLVDEQARRVRFIPVTPGARDGELVQILEPPLSGQVVTLGNHLLEDGTAVMLSGPGKPPLPAAGTGKTGGGAKK